MTIDDLVDWWVYESVEPFGEMGDWVRTGIVASVIANANRDPKRTGPLTPSDFMPQFEDSRSNMEEAEKQFVKFVKSHNKAVRFGG